MGAPACEGQTKECKCQCTWVDKLLVFGVVVGLIVMFCTGFLVVKPHVMAGEMQSVQCQVTAVNYEGRVRYESCSEKDPDYPMPTVAPGATSAPGFPCLTVWVTMRADGVAVHKGQPTLLHRTLSQFESREQCSFAKCMTSEKNASGEYARRMRDNMQRKSEFNCFRLLYKNGHAIESHPYVSCRHAMHSMLWPTIFTVGCIIALIVRRCCRKKNAAGVVAPTKAMEEKPKVFVVEEPLKGTTPPPSYYESEKNKPQPAFTQQSYGTVEEKKVPIA